MTRATLLALDLDGLFPRYGYPNDLLARLRVAGARVVDVPVRPIYGPMWRSGITLRTAIYPVLFVVVRSLLWRKWAERRASRSASSQQAPRVTPPAAEPGPTPPAPPSLPEVAAVGAGEEALTGKGSCASA